MDEKYFDRYIGAHVTGSKKYLNKRNNIFNKLIHKEKLNNLLDDLEKNYEGLKEEYFRVTKEEDFIGYPLRNLYEFGWKAVGVKYKGINIYENHKKFPILSSISKKYNRIVDLAGYSKLEAGAKIGLHSDEREQVTVHLSIKMPEGDCAFKMFDVTTRLQEGKTHFFYSNDRHEAWNFTNEDRTILIFDIKKMGILKTIVYYVLNIKIISNFLIKRFFKVERKRDLEKNNRYNRKL